MGCDCRYPFRAERYAIAKVKKNAAREVSFNIYEPALLWSGASVWKLAIGQSRRH
jgi:hypothetical protein